MAFKGICENLPVLLTANITNARLKSCGGTVLKTIKEIAHFPLQSKVPFIHGWMQAKTTELGLSEKNLLLKEWVACKAHALLYAAMVASQ